MSDEEDVWEESEDEGEEPDVVPVHSSRWKERGVAGSIMGAIAGGFYEVFEKKKQEKPAIVQEADTPDDNGEAMSVTLDADKPEDTVVRLRPWKMDETEVDESESE